MTNSVSEQNTLFNGQKTLTFSFSFCLPSSPHPPNSPVSTSPLFTLTLSEEKGPGSTLHTPIHLDVANNPGRGETFISQEDKYPVPRSAEARWERGELRNWETQAPQTTSFTFSFRCSFGNNFRKHSFRERARV